MPHGNGGSALFPASWSARIPSRSARAGGGRKTPVEPFRSQKAGGMPVGASQGDSRVRRGSGGSATGPPAPPREIPACAGGAGGLRVPSWRHCRRCIRERHTSAMAKVASLFHVEHPMRPPPRANILLPRRQRPRGATVESTPPSLCRDRRAGKGSAGKGLPGSAGRKGVRREGSAGIGRREGVRRDRAHRNGRPAATPFSARPAPPPPPSSPPPSPPSSFAPP